VCLYVFVANHVLPDVRDVVVRECKVGMHGLTGMSGEGDADNDLERQMQKEK
jgi:hypothetical protein